MRVALPWEILAIDPEVAFRCRVRALRLRVSTGSNPVRSPTGRLEGFATNATAWQNERVASWRNVRFWAQSGPATVGFVLGDHRVPSRGVGQQKRCCDFKSHVRQPRVSSSQGLRSSPPFSPFSSFSELRCRKRPAAKSPRASSPLSARCSSPGDSCAGPISSLGSSGVGRLEARNGGPFCGRTGAGFPRTFWPSSSRTSISVDNIEALRL